MNIKNRLFMSAGISIILVVILLSLGLVTSGRINEISKKHELVDDMRRGIAELDIIAYDYLLHGEKRMEQQWSLRYNSLAEILDEAEEETFKLIHADFIAVGDIFSQVTTNYTKRQKLIQEKAPQKMIDAATGIEERLVAQLLITSHSIITSASRLAKGVDAEETKARRLVANLTLILIIILAITVTTSSLLVARSISKPLNELIKGIEIIGEGAFDHKIVVGTKDEMGQLASSFNKMTKDLQQITVSRDELEKEITERKQAEEALKNANKELEAFSYSVSHDLRAPLRAITGFSQKLLKNFGDKLDDEGKRLVNVIVDNGQKMGHLIDDLLTFSRTGRKKLSITRINIKEMAESVIKEINADIRDRSIQYKTDNIPPAFGDYSLIRSVLTNLIGNAVKYSQYKDKTIIEIGANSSEDIITYYVKDNGSGFDMRYVDKLFGVFQRLHSEKEFEGTGIGLSIVQRIIHRHGGHIWAEGEENKGATFYFTLPKKEILSNELQ